MHNYMAAVVKFSAKGMTKKVLCSRQQASRSLSESLQGHVSLALSFWHLRFPIDAP